MRNRVGEAVRRGSAETYVEVPVAGADLSFLQYTGGTTAAPKAAALTHANLCANILQSQAWVKGALRPSALRSLHCRSITSSR